MEKQLTIDFERDDSKPNRDRVYLATLPWHAGDCKRVLEHLRQCGQQGATRHEIADALRIPLSGVCGRVSTLLKAGKAFVVDGRVRMSPFGRPADVVFAKEE